MFKRLAENFKYYRYLLLYSYHRACVIVGIIMRDNSVDESKKERWAQYVEKHVTEFEKYIALINEREYKSLFEKYNKERP